MKPLLMVLCMAMWLVSPALASDARDAFERGLSAQRSGDNVAALKEFQFAAEHGDPDAQGRLGTLYIYGGRGIQRDYVLAHMWLSLAVANGAHGKERSASVTNSSLVANLMKPEQIAEAKKRAQAWAEAHPAVAE
jgi:TPR repeat protein